MHLFQARKLGPVCQPRFLAAWSHCILSGRCASNIDLLKRDPPFFFHEYGRCVDGVPGSSMKRKKTQHDEGKSNQTPTKQGLQTLTMGLNSPRRSVRRVSARSGGQRCQSKGLRSTLKTVTRRSLHQVANVVIGCFAEAAAGLILAKDIPPRRKVSFLHPLASKKFQSGMLYS